MSGPDEIPEQDEGFDEPEPEYVSPDESYADAVCIPLYKEL